ncbi:suppressor of fused domain protein [Bradyrhizobium sp. sBnM-33]|uniref:suppressor of fused domain protein n=1 Tax=Bradyrhizobium sp. sBnM-33 TaxID=2831780 RepID=UPI0020C015F5|nr:suppressor of fused domain protein [Bradyrhizobium sp. sBnM-33]WOH48971.1 suppressor of fused domain protein [Bradyrhizobium sp. sBnM-33]
MSEQRMAVPAQAEAKRGAELTWYVRDATPEISTTLRWLASLPFIDNTWFGF